MSVIANQNIHRDLIRDEATLEKGFEMCEGNDGASDNTVNWFFPSWAAEGANNKPIMVLDTDSALGRYNEHTKELGLKDLARVHGHLCDGLVIAYVFLKAAFDELFEGGVVDRTDLRVVTKNSPCMVDTAGMMSGARINFQTLRIQAGLENVFIVQRISTSRTVEVRMKDGVFPKEIAGLAAEIRSARAKGETVTAKEIDRIEELHNDLSRAMLNEPLDSLLEINELDGYKFHFNDLYVGRGDVINKDMPR